MFTHIWFQRKEIVRVVHVQTEVLPDSIPIQRLLMLRLIFYLNHLETCMLETELLMDAVFYVPTTDMP